MTKIFCDRCGIELTLITKRSVDFYCGEEYDLCEECEKKVISFIEDGDVAKDTKPTKTLMKRFGMKHEISSLRDVRKDVFS